MTVQYENKDRLNSLAYILGNLDKLNNGEYARTGNEVIELVKAEIGCLEQKCFKSYSEILQILGQFNESPKVEGSEISKGLGIPVSFNFFDFDQLVKAEGEDSTPQGTKYNSLAKDFLYFSSQIVKMNRLIGSIDESKQYNFSKSIISKLGI